MDARTGASEIRAILIRLSLSQTETGALLGCGVNNISNWTGSRRRVPALLLTTLRLLDRHPDLVDELRASVCRVSTGRPSARSI